MSPKLEQVRITPFDGTFVVEPIWADVDRPHTRGFSTTSLSYAQRLKAAFVSGKAYRNAVQMKDANGKTFIDFDCVVYMRHLPSELKRLGV
jgi:hypothetical protein